MPSRPDPLRLALDHLNGWSWAAIDPEDRANHAARHLARALLYLCAPGCQSARRVVEARAAVRSARQGERACRCCGGRLRLATAGWECAAAGCDLASCPLGAVDLAADALLAVCEGE